MRGVVAALAGLAALAAAGPATAAEVVLRDRERRPIHFDIRASGVNVRWHAELLRNAAHSDEISHVTIRIVEWNELAETCGRAAAGCYSTRRGRDLLVVPAVQSRRSAHTLLHEYGHHVDARRRHGGLREPNGTPLWWRARGMGELVRVQSVRRNYSRGWSRSIGEVFAEDYAYTVLGRRYRIGWLQPPDRVVRQALLADLGLAAPPDLTARRPAVRPVVIDRSGTLSPGERVSIPFGLLGPGRRVTVQARAGGSARIEVRCGGFARSRPVAGAGTTTLDLRRLGPAECSASLVSTTSAPARYAFTVRLSVER
jgi:hypothetical protein